MARGWESKAVEAQQEEAFRESPIRSGERAEPAAARARRATLELARARARADLAAARVPAHRTMLERALAALDEQLANL